MKIKEDEAGLEEKQYPVKECPFCEKKSTLDFDPVDNPQKFDGWECPHCGASNYLVWTHHNDPNSHQAISQILLTFQQTIGPVVQTNRMEVFRLPVTRPEIENKSILVLACEMLDMIEVRKHSRKKILFS